MMNYSDQLVNINIGSLPSVSPPNPTSPTQGFATDGGVSGATTTSAPQIYAAAATHY